YDETRYGGVVSFGHRFKNRWYGELAARIEGVDISSLDSSAPPEVRSDKGTHAIVGLKGTLVRDRTDSRWLPSTGDRFRLGYEQVTGDFDFGRATGEYRIYRTLYVDALDRKHIVSGRAATGYIFGDAPVFERFYGGGIGSVRGFEYRGISPRSSGTDQQIGGEFNFLAGAEYEFPLVGDQLRGVVFMDTGTVEEDFGVTAYRASVGVGVRWVVPLLGPVPMSFNLAFPISKSGDDDTQVFSFSIGVTF
ncbi:MAG: outer membrane protein assembly factor, partial [Phycisphaerae bacterium]|nr:outer membrane protein assembly factor [Phycisphaerae bacterium]